MAITGMKAFVVLVMMIIVTVFGFGCCKAQTLNGADNPTGLAQRLDTDTIAMVHNFMDMSGVYCTGTWVSKRVIVTANHCVDALAEITAQEEWLTAFAKEHNMPLPVALELVKMGLIPLPEDIFAPRMALDFTIATKDNFRITEEGTIPPEILLHGHVLVLEPSHDLALIEILGDVGDHGIAPLADDVSVGEKIHSVGHPSHLTWTHVDGIVAAFRTRAPWVEDQLPILKGPFTQISAPLWHGNSGGAVYNDRGEIIGICSFLGKAPDSVFLIPVSELRGLMIGQHLIRARI
jgi:hypothetical protein